MIKKIAIKILRKLGYSLQRIGNSKFISASLSEILGFEINSGNYSFLSYSLDFLKALKNHGAVYSFVHDKLIIQIQQLYFQVNSWDELFILNEIFAEGVYNVSFEGNFALLDIGMNVGMASLYFAHKKNCEVVFAYEPFRETIEVAKSNMQLNKCSEKIQINNTGLGYPTRTVAVPYSEESRGSAGIHGRSGLSAKRERKILKDLHIRDVAEYFSKNLEQYKETFIAKIDCEGAEYEIIERLNHTGLLTKINIYMIEWHIEGPEILQSVFIQNGYYVFCRDNNDQTGLLYAIKKS